MQIKKFWHMLGTIGLGALYFGTTAAQTAVQTHGTAAGIAVGLWALLGAWLPSPFRKLQG